MFASIFRGNQPTVYWKYYEFNNVNRRDDDK